MDAHSIAADLRRRIIAGELPHQSRLPSVRDQVQHYSASQQTVSAAYAALAALGLIRTDSTSGSYVTAARQSDAHLGTFTPPDLAAAQAWQPTADGESRSQTTLVQQITAPAGLTGWGIAEGTDIVERTRMRYVDDVPVQHKLTIMPYRIAACVPEGHEGTPPMLAPAGADSAAPPSGIRVADWLGWDVTGGTDVAITIEPMDTAAATALGVPEGSPGYRIVGITRDGDGNTVCVTVTTAQLHHRITLSITG
ncbi:GntR family transcriptional regulator [Streptomyces sp. NPDC057638]|uniref:GntR family transcriptional regulator n=1 Tax=Streptomyces sp. NPDC057638 TaxID=3346190 RepID=UPI00368D57E2